MPVHLTGRLICMTEAEAATVRTHLPDHIRLTRDEPGCEMFEVRPASPLVWDVAERFTDRAAFDAHQARTRASVWGRATTGIHRDFTIRED
jgi:quinol monooxygenase YgiN